MLPAWARSGPMRRYRARQTASPTSSEWVSRHRDALLGDDFSIVERLRHAQPHGPFKSSGGVLRGLHEAVGILAQEQPLGDQTVGGAGDLGRIVGPIAE